jgi:23S rRNA (uracil1939-C5)-methyltransferase
LVRGWSRGVRGGILDLYCGAGIFGLAAATAPGTRPAWLAGVEESAAAAADARRNAAARPWLRASVSTGPAERVLPRLAAEGRLAGLELVIADPPRKGLAGGAREALLALRPPALIYVSCDPATLARDLAPLLAAEYTLAEAVPVDMFPQTYHVEVLARLIRRH